MVNVIWASQCVSFIDFLTDNEPPTYIIIRSLLKTQQSQPFVQNDEVDQSKASVSPMTTRVRTPPLL
jgi:hypothetical protein